ncbi:envelope integrity protein Cei [Amycolatopsis taiwanensis]|uniref:envelope integrity protein Cei n=1 Tax=Amycolatopsis taiwanensis TaxID=342230 RepID=UPI0005C2499E|nr:envelope integrity protein Cei [Amycolatopsis taiwanensis]
MPFGNRLGKRTSRPYRRYRPLPAVIVLVVLGLVAMVVWVRAIASKADIDAQTRCSPPATPPAGVIFTSVGHGALDDAAPLPLEQVAVRVLNASQSRGLASITTESLRQQGFTQVAPPDNDPAYPQGNAKCRGQIRFGEHGTSAARTLSFVAPCAELVKDNRADATVDLVIGNGFTDLQITEPAHRVLQQLQDWSAQHPGGGNDQSATSPVIDPSLLAAAHDVAC